MQRTHVLSPNENPPVRVVDIYYNFSIRMIKNKKDYVPGHFFFLALRRNVLALRLEWPFARSLESFCARVIEYIVV